MKMNSQYETKVFRIHTQGDNRYGFTLVGQYPCKLAKIQEGSPADQAGIRSGDEVVEVNGVNVEDLKHNCVATFITPNNDGITEIRIRRGPTFAKTLRSGRSVHQSVSEDVYPTNPADDLSNVVDQVVEGFRRPDINSPSQHRVRDLAVFNNDDIASDEQLKMNFSPVKPAINTSVTADVSTPITLNLKVTPKNHLREKSLEVLVRYLGSIHHPVVTKTSTGLVTHLRVQKSSSAWVLLKLNSTGIYVRNSSKQIIKMSSLSSLAYLGVSHENKQILALFTEDFDANNAESNGVISKDVAINSDCKLNCSCFVFLIEPAFGSHANHKLLMDSFHLLCDPKTGSCQQYFPTSTESILNAIRDTSQQSFAQISEAGIDTSCSNVNSLGTEVEILRELGVITPQELISSDHSSLNRTQHEEKGEVLCVHLQPLLGSIRMMNQETDDPSLGDYSVEICGKEQPDTGQESVPATLATHHNKCNTRIATSKPENTYMAEKNMLKLDDSRKAGQSTRKTLVHQRSHSLASNVKNALQAQAAAAAVVAAAHTVECYSQGLQIGNGVGQLFHAASASVLAGTTVASHLEGKVARWAVAFDRLLEDKSGLAVFKSFLQKEFSEENLIFWLACEHYKTLEDAKELQKCAEDIYDKHLKPCATLPVNVDSTAIKELESNLQEPSAELFTSLQYQVYTLMKFDSYTRFLKSELYRECLMNEIEGKPLPVEHEEDERRDEGISTLKRMFSSKGKGRKTPAKSQASAESDESKKKSILPWRGRLKSDQPKRHTHRSSDSQASSTRSSLSSLSDSVFSPAITNSDETLDDSDGKEHTSPSSREAPPTCKVILPSSSLMYLFCKSTRSLKEGLSKLCENKEYSLPALDIYLNGRKLTKEDLQKKLTRFINKEIVLKQKILFRLELPKDRTIGIKADENQSVEEALEPILRQSGIDVKEYDIFLRGGDQPISTNSSVSLLHQGHVIVKEKTIKNVSTSSKPALATDEHSAKTYAQHTPTKSVTAIDHKVFEGIMLGKRQSMSGFSFDEHGVFVPMVKLQSSGSRGSRESLTSVGKEKMPRSPAIFRKKKRNVQTQVSTFRTYVGEDKKTAEEFFVLLHRSQNSRMDDQRGLLNHKNIELPDFLKQEVPGKRHSPLLVGVPSPRPVHQPLKRTASSPPNYATLVSKQQLDRPEVITEEVKPHTLSRFTRNWSGSALGRAKVHVETITETQTIDRRRFFKHSHVELPGRLQAESLSYTHPDERCNESAGELGTRNRYHYESETALNNNNNEVVWVSNSLNKNRMRSSAKSDPSGDTGNEIASDDEGSMWSFPATEVIIPEEVTKTERYAVSGNVVPFSERSTPGSPYFRENMETAKCHVRTLTEQSRLRDLPSGNDREAIHDSSFLRDQLEPLRLHSQHSPEVSSPSASSSPNEWNGTPLKCPLFIPPGMSYSTDDQETSTPRDNHAVEPSPRICWETNERTKEEGNVRVTFV